MRHIVYSLTAFALAANGASTAPVTVISSPMAPAVPMDSQSQTQSSPQAQQTQMQGFGPSVSPASGGVVVNPTPATTAPGTTAGPASTTAGPASTTVPGTTAGPASTTAPGTTAGPASTTAPGTTAGPASTTAPGTTAAPASTTAPSATAGPAATTAPNGNASSNANNNNNQNNNQNGNSNANSNANGNGKAVGYLNGGSITDWNSVWTGGWTGELVGYLNPTLHLLAPLNVNYPATLSTWNMAAAGNTYGPNWGSGTLVYPSLTVQPWFSQGQRFSWSFLPLQAASGFSFSSDMRTCVLKQIETEVHTSNNAINSGWLNPVSGTGTTQLATDVNYGTASAINWLSWIIPFGAPNNPVSNQAFVSPFLGILKSPQFYSDVENNCHIPASNFTVLNNTVQWNGNAWGAPNS